MRAALRGLPKEGVMNVSVRPRARVVRLMVVAAGMAILAGWSISGVGARQAQGVTGVLGGTVESTAGPEAGVWVIAETDDLETKFVKIVVTDDAGAFPDARTAVGYLRRVGARVWASGLGRRSSSHPGGRTSGSPASSHRRQPPLPNTIRETTGTPSSSRHPRVISRVRVRTGTGSPLASRVRRFGWIG